MSDTGTVIKRDVTVNYISLTEDNKEVIVGFTVPMAEVSMWKVGDKITIRREVKR